MEEADPSGEPYVIIDGPTPSESEHIYNRFFLSLERSTYTSEAIADIKSRRAHVDLSGRLFYDELISLTFVNKIDENAIEVEKQDPTIFYPPRAEDADSIIDLIGLIQSSSFDRIKKMALWYYLMLDLDVEGNLLNALHLAKEMCLPDSARYAMTGYWLLDKGQYPAAVSYLTEQPDFVTKILQTISPLRYASTSREATHSRALAFSYFISVVNVEEMSAERGDELEENRIVAICWTEGIRAAWVQAQDFASLVDIDEVASIRSRLIGRILEFCFMPQAREDAVKSLLALPLSDVDEELLNHSIINIPAGIHFTAHAHAVALDVLLVRRINSGHYYDAIMLERRINSTTGLPYLVGDRLDDEERLKLKRLRRRREGLIKSAYSVMTRIERQMLDFDQRQEENDEEAEMVISTEEQGTDLEMSWEKVDGQSTPRKRAQIVSSSSKLLTPLSASPAIRRDQGDLNVSESFLNAIAKSSPKRGDRIQSRQSGTASPLSQSISRTDKSRDRIVSLLQGTDSAQKRTPSRSLLSPRGKTPASPLAVVRPYSLQSSQSPRPLERISIDVGDKSMEETEEADKTLPVASLRFTEQLRDDIERGEGDLNVESILSIQTPFKTLQGASQPRNESRQASLSFAKPSRRYEARYEITDEQKSQPSRAVDEEQGVDDIDMMEVPKRRGAQSIAKSRRTKASASNQVNVNEKQQADDDESIPGSFPAEGGAEGGRRTERTKEKEKENDSPAKKRLSRRTTGKPTLKAGDLEDEHDNDEVPDLPMSPKIRKSRSGGAISRTRSANKLTSTPVRRSTRLSVEPEGTPRNEAFKESAKRSRRATSKVPSITSASEREEMENDEDYQAAASTPARRTRRSTKMPGAL